MWILKAARECGISKFSGFLDILLKQWLEHAMALVFTANRHTHKAYIKWRENNFSLNGLINWV